MASLDDLRQVIKTCPVIDNHAHNLLRSDKLDVYSLLTATTEAQGDALQDTPRSLSHLRAVKQLRELYDAPEGATWEELMLKRNDLIDKDYYGLISQCLQGTHTILIDDGINTEDTVHSYSWHDQFTTAPCKRIVRIETVAADIMQVLCRDDRIPMGRDLDDTAIGSAWVLFLQAFEAAIATEIKNKDVVGFKSVCCYRSGLDIQVAKSEIDVATTGQDAFFKYVKECARGRYRISVKGLNDCLVISTCKLLTAQHAETGVTKPFQFHTGLGDNDISLLKANPACLQPLIAHFSHVNFVLLHSAYPYTREAGYLATVYKNTYLDLGEVFPMVNRDGQMAIIKESLELTPLSKLLWSTDGHHFPETYWLANKQFREVFEKVIVGYVNEGDLTIPQAIQATQDILFNNSNLIYHLGLQLPNDTQKTLLLTSSPHKTNPYDNALLNTFVSKHDPHFIICEWLDYLGIIRSRMFPLASFTQMVQDGSHFSMSLGNIGTLQDDSVTSAVNTTGQILLEPDLASFKPVHRSHPLSAATVIASFRDDHGAPMADCPRGTLQRLMKSLHQEHSIDLLVGFEIEVTFLSRTGNKDVEYEQLDTNHAWGTLSPEQYTKSLSILGQIVTGLQECEIHVLHFHSESGKGQYEFVLPPLPPIEAIDTLVRARQTIQQIAETHQLRATLHPIPFEGIGTAAHAHISLNSSKLSTEELQTKEMPLFAGILKNLSAICATTLPEAVSYKRVVDNGWTGGTWITWGTQNRETPLRRINSARWEIRCIDGMANMYLALGALMGAGLSGIEEGEEMSWKDCEHNPSQMTEEQRMVYGITKRMPATIEESLLSLEENKTLEASLGSGIIKTFVAMKRKEQKKLEAMPDGERRVWLVERY